MFNDSIQFLGQSGFKFNFNNTTIFIDPYLSKSLENLYGSIFRREKPVFLDPNSITDADYVMITHIHQDHCDLDSLFPIYKYSKNCLFISSNEVCNFLISSGFDKGRLLVANDELILLNNDIKVRPIPAAHPTIEKDYQNCYKYLGFLFELDNYSLYHSGDTSVNSVILEFLKQYTPVNTVILPINEHNFIKEKIGILGNMGIRDAFYFAELLQCEELIPMHWDMFECNSVFKEEIILLYDLLKPKFNLNLL